LPVVAGAVLSGAYFGDKMSPLSDTTNMAPAMVGTDLYTHIKHMSYTTGVSYGLTLVIEFVLGFFYGGGQAELEKVNQILTGIDAQFSINPFNAVFSAMNPSDQLIFIDKPFTKEPIAWAIRKNDPDFMKFLNNFLAQTKADGRFDKIYNKWFNSSNWYQFVR